MIMITETQVGVWERNTDAVKRWYDKNESKLSDVEKKNLLNIINGLYKFGVEIKREGLEDPNSNESVNE